MSSEQRIEIGNPYWWKGCLVIPATGIKYPEGMDQVICQMNVASDKGHFNSWITLPAEEAEFHAAEIGAPESCVDTLPGAKGLSFRFNPGDFWYAPPSDVIKIRFQFRNVNEEGGGEVGNYVEFTFKRSSVHGGRAE